jgi:hypothetical protein
MNTFKTHEGYLGGTSLVASIILAILMPLGWVCGIITRIQQKHYLCALIMAILFFSVWIDLICLIIWNNKIIIGLNK